MKRSAIAKKHKRGLKLLVTLEPGEDGYVVVECPAIPGCMSQGRTREEALENIKDAILACLEVRKKRGMPMTVETQEVEVAV
ncbi:type II toxin-antitoxin system HicB family antitoxin [Candidatus Acetothermia bacterium]|nr:type II toxin-antitoxin system HicB family antitoxin [Candidatus Acetothermia bacterium]MBI3461295.1 type II toxin-antitoxin system HicB family antitoxin [Candidatus Acetothermia bacterium]MBI3659617.1 type II toxin-antitoxin system HicB family antitoxin [Candidatus Acetothermia bacterium]